MQNLLDHFDSAFDFAPAPEAPDGDVDVLKSGKWATHQSIPAEAFPAELLLVEGDDHLYGHAAEQTLLASVPAGEHCVELLLWASSPKGVGLGLRIPTARNQYKEPYLLMEAESGNTAEEAVREINFHLLGRVAEEQVLRVDWAAFFGEAARTLRTLRG